MNSTKYTNSKTKLFYSISALCLISSIIYGIVTHGEALANILFYRGKPFIFSDFYGMVDGCGPDNIPYEEGAIYPPLAVLFFKFIAMFFGKDLSISEMKNTSVGIITVVIFYIITSIILALLIFKIRKVSKANNTLFVFFTIFSLPMIFLFERGNVVNIALICLLFYIYGYDSEKAWVRQLSYIALSIATAFKIYPVIFGLLLLRKKNNLKNIISCIAWGVGIFFVPFIFVGGFGQVPKLIQNIIYTSSLFSEKGYGYKVSITPVFSYLGEVLHHKYLFDLAGNAVLTIVMISGILLMLFGRFNAKWKLVCVGAIWMIIVPGFSFIYNIVYMIIPLMMFLDEKKKNKLDYIYAILFVLQFALLVTKDRSFILEYTDSQLMMNITTLIEAFSLYAMAGLLWIEGIITSFKEYHKTKVLKVFNINALLAISMVATVAIGGVYSYQTTAEKSNFSVTALDIFTPQNKESKAELKQFESYANTNFGDSTVIAFPKCEITNSTDKIDYFYDISYCDNTKSTIKKIAKKSPDYIVIYNVYASDIKASGKSTSVSELETIEAMKNRINRYCFNNGYEKAETYSINGKNTLVVWVKTENKSNHSWYESGKGTPENPYKIATASQLESFSDYVNAGNSMKEEYVELSSDIDMSNCKNFAPIANEKGSIKFKGTFDGNGYSIKNLTIEGGKSFNSKEKENVALFGKLAGTIKNLTIENSSFSGENASTFVTKGTEDSAIINCKSINNNFVATNVGEFAGDFEGSIISSISLGTKAKCKSIDIVGTNNESLKLNCVFTDNKDCTALNAYATREIILADSTAKMRNEAIKSFNK